MSASVRIESPLQEDVRGLIGEVNAALRALTPPEFCFQMTPEDMAGEDTTVYVAREGGRAVACGALRRHEGGLGEVKRMYTRTEARVSVIGGAILAAIEARAGREGFGGLVLEPGHRNPAAWPVYERAGFSRCGPILDYPDSPYSVFYEMRLVERDKAA